MLSREIFREGVKKRDKESKSTFQQRKSGKEKERQDEACKQRKPE